jgi:carboxyl-terminal processing protease
MSQPADMKKKILFVFIFIAVLARLGARDEDVWDQSLEKISSIVALIDQNYFESVNPEKMMQESVKGMLQTLDPHSYFLDPNNFSRMFEEQKGKYYGLGIQIQKQEDRLVVISPIEGTPAWRLGIQAGDVITHINGESTKPISSQDAVDRLRGPKGTRVNITIAREGLEQPIDLTITREEIPLFSVPYAFMLQEGVGYIFIRYFAESTAEEFDEKMADLTKKGMKSLILDLRGNAGGPLFQAIDIADEFLPKDSLIVSVKGRNRMYDREYASVRNNQYEKLPVVVLINQGSASASEIVAGAIMDHDRGLVLGEDSWGKGLVQTIFPVAPNMAVALTIAKYYTPSGRSIQRDYSRFDDYILDNKIAPEKPREVKYTSKGRKVLGQGGITPDYEVKFSLKLYTFELRGQGAFFAFARKFISHQTALSRNFIFPQEAGNMASIPQGKILIGKIFVADSAVLEDFKDYLLTNELNYDEKRFKEAESEIKRELEREIVSAIWSIEEGWNAFEQSDPVIMKALQVMPEAAKFIDG